MKKSREVLGHIIKEERISLINHNKLDNTLVINIDHPFPGFHGIDFDFLSKPRSIIICTSELYSLAKILRQTKKINDNYNFDINASFAKIKVGKQLFYGIRVKGLDSYAQIPELQRLYQHYGFQLLKKKKIKTDIPVSIKISKFFHIVELDERIYEDACIDDMYYIEIENYLAWETFRDITMHVKNNVSNNNYDVIKGVFYKDDCVKDIIRIYKPKISIELLKEIRDRYNKEIIATFS